VWEKPHQRDWTCIFTLSSTLWSIGMFFSLPLCVWEKNIYVLSLIRDVSGTSLIPKMMSAFEISSVTIAPAFDGALISVWSSRHSCPHYLFIRFVCKDSLGARLNIHCGSCLLDQLLYSAGRQGRSTFPSTLVFATDADAALAATSSCGMVSCKQQPWFATVLMDSNHFWKSKKKKERNKRGLLLGVKQEMFDFYIQIWEL